jgi:hypothetical protein
MHDMHLKKKKVEVFGWDFGKCKMHIFLEQKSESTFLEQKSESSFFWILILASDSDIC